MNWSLHSTDRRKLLLNSVRYSVAGTLFSPLLAVPASAQYEAIIYAVIAVINVIESFSNSDGGLTALLTAEYKMLQLVLDQLKNIQVEIAALSEQVAKLPGEFQKQLNDSYQRELLDGIAGAAANYRAYTTKLDKPDDYPQNGPLKRRLESLLAQVSDRRGSLSASVAGLGPQSALALPVELGLEISLMSRLHFPKSSIYGVLRLYAEWIDRIASATGPGSLAQYERDAIAAHDDALDRAMKTVAGAGLGLDRLKFNSPSTAKDPQFRDCFAFVLAGGQSLLGEGLGLTTVGNLREMYQNHKANGAYPWRFVMLVEQAKIIAKPDSENRIMALGYEDIEPAVIFDDSILLANCGIPDGAVCRPLGVMPASLDAPTLLAIAKKDAAYNDVRGKIVDVDQFLLDANLARYRLAVAAAARTIAADTQQKALKYRSTL